MSAEMSLLKEVLTQAVTTTARQITVTMITASAIQKKLLTTALTTIAKTITLTTLITV